MLYSILKHIHMTTVAITFVLFNLRFVWMLQDSPRLQQWWVKRLPHTNDTILLLAVERAGERAIPRMDTTIEAEDVLTVFSLERASDELVEKLAG